VEEFYKGFAQRARDLAENADPFTRRRLLDLAQRYNLKSKPGSGSGRSIPPQRATPPTALFSASGGRVGSPHGHNQQHAKPGGNVQPSLSQGYPCPRGVDDPFPFSSIA
jgi:hypothetical protein